MERNTFIKQLSKICDVNVKDLQPLTMLESLESWDSMAAVSFLVMAKTEYGLSLSGPQMLSVRTVEDLWNLILEGSNSNENQS